MNPMRKSLSLRLLGIFILIALLSTFLIAQLFSKGMGSQWRNNIQPHLIQYLSYVHDDVGTPPDHDNALSLSQQLPVNIYIYKGKTLEYSTNNESLDYRSIKFIRPPKIDRESRGDKREGHESRDAESKPRPPRKNKRGRLPLPPDHAFGFSREDGTTYLRVKQDEHTLYYELLRRNGKRRFDDHFWWGLLGLAGLLGISYFTIKRQLSPIQHIKQGVSEMSQGNLQTRIPIKGGDDLAQLGHSINDMAERIEKMLDAKRQLLMAISHELRSPLARSRVANELLPDSLNKKRIGEDLDEMDKLIHEIMESERLQHHTDLNYRSTNLVALIKDVTSDITLNEPDAIQLELNQDSLVIDADDARIRILLRNLINNALQHGQGDATQKIRVLLDASEATVKLRVIDSGPGIDAAYIEQLGEPLYRPDESRTRSTGGFGMGLALVKRIVDTHGGSMTITSQTSQPSGTTVEVQLPITRTSD